MSVLDDVDETPPCDEMTSNERDLIASQFGERSVQLLADTLVLLLLGQQFVCRVEINIQFWAVE